MVTALQDVDGRLCHGVGRRRVLFAVYSKPWATFGGLVEASKR